MKCKVIENSKLLFTKYLLFVWLLLLFLSFYYIPCLMMAKHELEFLSYEWIMRRKLCFLQKAAWVLIICFFFVMIEFVLQQFREHWNISRQQNLIISKLYASRSQAFKKIRRCKIEWKSLVKLFSRLNGFLAVKWRYDWRMNQDYWFKPWGFFSLKDKY